MRRTAGFHGGQIITALAGRERGQHFVVVGMDDDHLYLADGRKRPVEKPKRKNPRHAKTSTVAGIPQTVGRWSNELVRQALSVVEEGWENGQTGCDRG